MKATLVRLGIRGFNPKLKDAAGDLEALRTPEGAPIPPNTLAELQRSNIVLASSVSILRSGRGKACGAVELEK